MDCPIFNIIWNYNRRWLVNFMLDPKVNLLCSAFVIMEWWPRSPLLWITAFPAEFDGGLRPRMWCFKQWVLYDIYEKETTIKLCGKSSDPNQLWSRKLNKVSLFLDLSNIKFTSQVQEHNPTEHVWYQK